jgi:TatD DNase family protein
MTRGFMIADTHAHLDMPKFDPDRREVIQRARDVGVDLIVTIAAGTPQGTSVQKSLHLAEEYDFIYAGIGVHPHDARLADEPYWDELESLAGHPKVVLWGEIGLDYYYDFSPREVQREVLRRQLRIARRRNLPVSLHCRDAWDDLMTILRQEYCGATRTGVVHSFTGTCRQALEGAALGFLISFSGIVTFKNAGSLQEAARALTPGQMLVETDCPYLAPVPHRGKRSEPAFVLDTARALARIKGIEFEAFAGKICANVQGLLGLPPRG